MLDVQREPQRCRMPPQRFLYVLLCPSFRALGRRTGVPPHRRREWQSASPPHVSLPQESTTQVAWRELPELLGMRRPNKRHHTQAPLATEAAGAKMAAISPAIGG